ACFALLQAAQALGFGAQWLKAWVAYDPEVTRLLGLGEGERIVGFHHIGTPRMEPPERERPDPRVLLSDWNPCAWTAPASCQRPRRPRRARRCTWSTPACTCSAPGTRCPPSSATPRAGRPMPCMASPGSCWSCWNA